MQRPTHSAARSSGGPAESLPAAPCSDAVRLIRDSADVPAAIRLIETTLERYSDGEPDASLIDNLRRVRQREQNPALYMGVIGEFSSGKSTFINALLGMKLLTADILGGTTAATTLIRYGGELNGTVASRNGEVRTARSNAEALSAQTLITWVKRYSADEELAKDVSRVSLEVPAKTLQDGLTIVDTPGLNADNTRHVGVTMEAVQSVCDSFVVVIPVDNPASQLLIDFLDEHLTGVLHRCIFVVTMADRLRREKELLRLIKNISARLRAGLGLDRDPLIFACAPEIALERQLDQEVNLGRHRPLPESVIQRYCAQFEELRANLLSFIERFRLVIVLEKSVTTLYQSMDTMESTVSHKAEEYDERHRALEANSIEHLGRYAVDRERRHVGQLERRLARIKGSGQSWARRRRDEALQELKDTLSETDPQELTTTATETSTQLLTRAQNALNQHRYKQAQEIAREARAEAAEFESDFRARYENLETLGGRLKHPSTNSRRIDVGRERSIDEVNQAALAIQEMVKKDNHKMAGGAVAGAVGGMFVFGPVGAVVGSVLGLFAGAMVGKSIEEMRTEAYQSVEPTIKEIFSKLQSDLERDIREMIGHAKGQLRNTIRTYEDRYAALVDEMIKRDQDAKRALQSLKRQAEEDRERLTERKRQLESVRDKCLNL